MFRVSHIVEVAKQSQQMPAMLSLLIGLFLLHKESYLFSDEDKSIGDNIPLTLVDRLNRK